MHFSDKMNENFLLNKPIQNYKYARFLAMVYLTFLLAATVVAYRIVKIGPFPEPGSTLIYTFSFFLANVYSEIYEGALARKLIFESIACGYIFAILLSVINLFPAPSYWNNQDAYDQVLGHVFRFTNAGVIGYLISSFLNVYLITHWKRKMNGKLFWLRSLAASSLSELAATFIAGIITFMGMLPTKEMFILLSSALIFKIIYGFIAIFPASFLAFYLKKKESAVLV